MSNSFLGDYNKCNIQVGEVVGYRAWKLCLTKWNTPFLSKYKSIVQSVVFSTLWYPLTPVRMGGNVFDLKDEYGFNIRYGIHAFKKFQSINSFLSMPGENYYHMIFGKVKMWG